MSKPRRITELQLTTNPSISDLIALARVGSNSRVTIGTLLNSGFPTTLGNTTINGDLIVNGTETIISSSVLYDSGSTIFGNSTDDIHNFIGDVSITGSLFVSGTTELGGDIFPQTPQGATLGTSEKPFREIYLQSGSISIESDTPGDPSAFISNFNGNVDIKAAGFSVTSGSISPFIINNEGQITIQNAYQDPANEAILQIIGNNEGNIQTAVNPGSLIHVTGFDGITNRNVFDSYGGGGVFSQLILRNANGTAANPTSTAAGIIGRVATSGFITDIGFGVEGVTGPPASMNFYTPGYRSGSRETMIRFYTTADNELDPNGYSAVIKAEGMEVTGSLEVTGSVDISGSLNTTGSSVFGGDVDVQGDFYHKGNKQYNYGQFYSLETQSGSADTAYAMKYEVTDGTIGVSITNNASGLPTRITPTNTGVYNIQFSNQLGNTANSDITFDIWFRINEVNVPNSNTKFSLIKSLGSGLYEVAALNFLTQLNAGQYVEIMWSCGESTGQFEYLGTQSTPTRPATPSIILTVTQIA
jgi:hypothetical protein